MKVILINSRHGGSRSLELGRWSRALVSLCCLGLPLGLVMAGYYIGQESEVRSTRGASLDNLQDELEEQSGEFDELKDLAQRRMQAMTLNLAGAHHPPGRPWPAPDRDGRPGRGRI